MTISPPESGEKNKKVLEDPVKADPRPIDFAKLDKPGFWSSKLSNCLLYTSPSPRDRTRSRMPSSA